MMRAHHGHAVAAPGEVAVAPGVRRDVVVGACGLPFGEGKGEGRMLLGGVVVGGVVGGPWCQQLFRTWW